MVAKGERAGRRMEWEVGVSGCKLLYIEWILHSTKNYIQYPMINHNGKRRYVLKTKQNKVCICIMESLCCTAVISTALYINHTSILEYRNVLKSVQYDS